MKAIQFDRDAVFGAFDDRATPVAIAHVAYVAHVAELGLSVLQDARKQGLGAALLDRAARHARSRDVSELRMHFLAENGALIRLAQRAGMRLDPHADEPIATISLPPGDASDVLAEALAATVSGLDLGFRRAALELAAAPTSA